MRPYHEFRIDPGMPTGTLGRVVEALATPAPPVDPFAAQRERIFASIDKAVRESGTLSLSQEHWEMLKRTL